MNFARNRLAATFALGLLAGPAAAQSYSRTEILTYYDDTSITNPQNTTSSIWVLGQLESVTCAAAVPANSACDGIPADVDHPDSDVINRTIYDASYALPLTTKSFGKTQATMGYDNTSTVASGQLGTLKTVTDGRGNTTTLTNWKRGIPQLVTFPAVAPAPAKTKSAVVDDNGLITSVTDEVGSKTCYSYDNVGRLTGVSYPSETVANTCDGSPTAPWKPLVRTFTKLTAAEYGQAIGQWRERVSTGNGYKDTYYDAFWRPVLARQYDSGNVAGSESFVKTTYDAGGRVNFTSYPSNTNTPTTGIWTSYDALGRTTSVSQDSELGLLTTTTAYNTGFTTTVTNPRLFATTTSYQTFDQPSTDAPVSIAAPETVTTAINRDPYGKPLSITRSGTYSGSGVSETRSYVYDTEQQLCKAVNPDSGATLVDYDDAGNVAWSVEGSALTSLICDRAGVFLADKTSFTYDARNRVTARATPGGTADVLTEYFDDGAVKKLTAANPGGFNVVTDYVYNKRRLLTGETQTNGSVSFALGYGYDANGNASSLTYPDGRIVTASPDALGRPTAIATGADLYATNVTYYRNGAMSGFRYGGLSTVTHTMTQNARLLPSRSQDVKTGSVDPWTILDDTYTYDANGNVLQILDQAQNFKRTMSYDGVDRLTSAVSDNLATPSPTNDGPFGTAAYAYDPLDNLRSADQGTRLFRYNYDANWRLATIKNPGGTTLYSFTHDARGNQLTKNTQDFVFDAANRMSSAEVTAGTGSQVYRYDGLGRRVQATDPNGTTTYWAYSRAGQVLYSSEGRRSRNIAYIYLGNTQVATRTQAWAPQNTVAIRYQYTDALGSPVADTDAAAASASVNRTNYAPYGEALAPAVVDGTGYTGHVMDAGTGLTYMQQRYYDPMIGRFNSPDPISVDTQRAKNFPRFAYSNNSPYVFTDPDGRRVAYANIQSEELTQQTRENSEVAEALFQDLYKSEKLWTISYGPIPSTARESESHVQADNEKAGNMNDDGTPNAGSGGTIYINSKREMVYVQFPARFGSRKPERVEITKPETLVHEMGHAVEIDKGIMSGDWRDNELNGNARKQEDAYRNEQGGSGHRSGVIGG